MNLLKVLKFKTDTFTKETKYIDELKYINIVKKAGEPAFYLISLKPE